MLYAGALTREEITSLYTSNEIITKLEQPITPNALQIKNPIEDEISLPEDCSIVKFSSIDGQISLTPNTNTINLKNVPKGLYIIMVEMNNDYYTQKIIVK